MTNEELLAKIKVEIERRIKRNKEEYAPNGLFEVQDNLAKLLSFLDTLEKSGKPMNQDGLEEEIERERNDCDGKHSDTDYHIVELKKDDFLSIARHFAEWGAEHASGSSEIPNDQPLPEDTVLFNQGVAEGRRLESEENKDRDIVFWRWIQYAKEQMLKDGLDAVKTFDFNKVEKTIAGVFVKYGMDRQKELMMREAVEGEVMGFRFVREVNYSSAKIEFSTIPELKVGDKVRIIVIPNTDEK